MPRLPSFSRTLLLSTLLIAGCSYTQKKDTGSDVPLKGGGSVSFAMVNEKIFQPNCITCHGGTHAPNLTNYQEVKANLAAIQDQVIEKQRMPKRGPLESDEMALLKQWILEGAPEFAANPVNTPVPTATPNPGAERPKIKYAELRAKVLKAKCFNCHYKSNPEKVSDLDDFDTFVGTIGTTYFVTVITPAMPPAPAGTPEGAPNPNQLTRSEKELLSNWVIDGMQP